MTNLFSKTEGSLFCGELFGMNMLLSPSLAVFPVVVLLFEDPELTISSDETPTRYFSSGLLTCLSFIMIYRSFSISFTRVHTKTSYIVLSISRYIWAFCPVRTFVRWAFENTCGKYSLKVSLHIAQNKWFAPGLGSSITRGFFSSAVFFLFKLSSSLTCLSLK